jgi:hypothetical protein
MMTVMPLQLMAVRRVLSRTLP